MPMYQKPKITPIDAEKGFGGKKNPFMMKQNQANLGIKLP